MLTTASQCIKELRDKSAHFKETGIVQIYDAELTIAKSDSAVSESVRDALCQGIKPLEEVPESQKDWHPGSNQMVLDLVHPSLFPVVFGLTRALEGDQTVPLDGCAKFTGKGRAVDSSDPAAREPTFDPAWRTWGPQRPRPWGSYQWLPAQVRLAEDGSAKITSYINNLHPSKHADLYVTLEQIVAATVPLWEACLSGFYDRRRIDLSGAGSSDWEYPEGLKYRIPGRESPNAWIDPFDEEEEENDEDDDWRVEEDFYSWKREHRTLLQREPRRYMKQTGVQEGCKLRHEFSFLSKDLSLREHQFGETPKGELQVIFKLANIHLTPEKPEYAGGTWHVEGAMNERICASAIYYFDQENITDSHLALRQSINQEEVIMMPEQNEFASLEAYLGVDNEGPAVQPLGQVLTCKGRLLAFPNCVQHQVQPFKLADASRPGYRKILAMFLVDPHRPILSSAVVPPQRRDWWAEEIRKEKGMLGSLPYEVFDHAVGMVTGFPISWERAVEIRGQLMEERGGFNEQLTEYINQVSLSSISPVADRHVTSCFSEFADGLFR